ncbi:MAG: YbjQ family protein [Candidatus Hydrogenedentota bacterium]
MIVVTSPNIVGKEIIETIGLVRGTTVRARHLGKDIMALFRNIVGGEVHEYTKMLAESREHALDRMCDHARGLGADAIVDARFSTSNIANGAAEVLVYGTAVRLRENSTS